MESLVIRKYPAGFGKEAKPSVKDILFLVHSLIKGERSGAIYGTLFTVLLALIFTCFPKRVYFFVILFLSGYNFFSYEYPYRSGLVTPFTPLNKRLYSTDAQATKNSTLSPYWVTGFTDAEGSFSLKLSKSSSTRSGYNVIPEFKIELHNRDILLLRKIHTFFGLGTIREYADKNKASYSVQSARDMAKKIIPHFDKYPLLTQKRADYLLFKEAINLLLTGKARSSIEGMYELINLKGSMNRMLSDKLRINFPNIKCVPRLVVDKYDIKDLN